MPNLNADNIRKVYATATPEEITAGLAWYNVAHLFCIGLAEEYDTDLDTAAGVVAAISPRLSWNLNLAYAERIFATGDAPLLGLSKGKALAILGGQTVGSVLQAPKGKPTSGQKVRAFYDNIRFTDDSTAVTIDRHAYDIAAGLEGSDATRKVLDRVGVYEEVANLYREVAAELDILPHQLQAITWIAWRRAKGIAD